MVSPSLPQKSLRTRFRVLPYSNSPYISFKASTKHEELISLHSQLQNGHAIECPYPRRPRRACQRAPRNNGWKRLLPQFCRSQDVWMLTEPKLPAAIFVERRQMKYQSASSAESEIQVSSLRAAFPPGRKVSCHVVLLQFASATPP